MRYEYSEVMDADYKKIAAFLLSAIIYGENTMTVEEDDSYYFYIKGIEFTLTKQQRELLQDKGFEWFDVVLASFDKAIDELEEDKTNE